MPTGKQQLEISEDVDDNYNDGAPAGDGDGDDFGVNIFAKERNITGNHFRTEDQTTRTNTKGDKRSYQVTINRKLKTADGGRKKNLRASDLRMVNSQTSNANPSTLNKTPSYVMAKPKSGQLISKLSGTEHMKANQTGYIFFTETNLKQVRVAETEKRDAATDLAQGRSKNIKPSGDGFTTMRSAQ